MVAKTYSATLIGLEAIKIEIEVDGHRGVPGLQIIGLPNRAVAEAKERVTAALQNLGIRIKSLKTLINLAPADLRKEPSHLELGMAMGLLSLYGMTQRDLSRVLFLGELSLDGQVKAVKGCLALVRVARSLGFETVIVPTANQNELSYLKLDHVFHVNDLQSVVAWAQGHRELPLVKPGELQVTPPSTSIFDQVEGQFLAKRAIMIAAVGRHHLLLNGSPGIGKTLLAQSLIEVLPALALPEVIEILALQSVTTTHLPAAVTRPFRSPHHTSSLKSLIGGGPQVSPGEISLAHRGVLFLDELAEFPRAHLEALRQPLEAKTISFVKQGRSLDFPADFQLIAATNPCPCGYALSNLHACRCSLGDRARYQQKLSGPLLDRIDLHCTLEETPSGSNLSLKQAQTQVLKALTHRSRVTPKLTSAAAKLVQAAVIKLGLSARSHQKLLKVATSIAHLAQSAQLKPDHIAEALQYRPIIPTLNER